VTPPGPKSIGLMKLQDKFVPKAVFHTIPVFVAESEGALVKDVDGNVYVDFASGISCLNTGHRNPEIVRAINEQTGRYLHLCMHVTPYEPYLRLAEKLGEIAPGKTHKKTVFTNSGAEAVENAVKIARKYTGKATIIVFENAFHGRTRLAMSLTSSVEPYKHGFGPQDPALHRTPYAYCYRCAFGLEHPQCRLGCIEYLRDALDTRLSPDDVAAILVEPIQAEGGFIIPPKDFIKELGKISKANDSLLIDDEVQSGMGRTGRMFAIEHFSVKPDIIAMAKSLGGGLPLGATVARADIMDSVQVGGLGGTFGGNPLSCVAGLKAIDITQRLLEETTMLGETLRNRLVEIYEQYEIIGDVRSIGLMAGVELVKSRETKQPAKDEEKRIIKYCHEHGLIIMSAGVYKNVVRFLPPLNISETLLTKGLDIFEDALRAVNV
jgi:4-aminobutyrate aminotransferase/(S)-3-amino-2-methylpropionate transaminase